MPLGGNPESWWTPGASSFTLGGRYPLGLLRGCPRVLSGVSFAAPSLRSGGQSLPPATRGGHRGYPPAFFCLSKINTGRTAV